MKKIVRLELLFIFLLLAGCGVRSYIDLQIPPPSLRPNQVGKQVFIRKIQDLREFQDKPTSEKTPSLKGGVKNTTREIKSRAVGRKRNILGRATGDYLLKEGQSVETIIQDVLTALLHELGYTVINSKDKVNPDAIIMDVDIKKFWTWFNIGMWVSSISTEIDTTIHVLTTPSQKIDWEISVLAKNTAATGITVTGQIHAVINLALARYKTKFNAQSSQIMNCNDGPGSYEGDD